MKKLAIMSSILILAPMSSFAGGMVICGSGKNANDAISELNVNLSSQSAIYSSQSGDGDNKRVDIKNTNVTAVSGVTIVNSRFNEFSACVTIFGASTKSKQ